MPITSIPSKQVFPTQPKVANLNQTATGGVYYTVVDVTNSRGILSRAVVTTASAGMFNSNYQIRVTIDGITNTLSTSFNNYAIGLNHTNSVGSADAEKSLDLFFNTNFLNSLKVEIYIASGTYQLVSSVFYQIE